MLIGCLFLAASPLLQDVTVFRGATVLPMDREETLPNTTLVIRDGVIASMGPDADAEPPEGSRVIDASGKFLMPGLVDMHVHLNFDHTLLLFVASGVTSVRNMSGRWWVDDWRDAVLSGKRLGPTIYSASTTIDCEPILHRGTTAVATAEEGVRAVREAEAKGYPFIKVYDSLTVDIYDAIVDAASVPVVGHVPLQVGLEHVFARGQHTIEHLLGYEGWLQPGGPTLPSTRRERARAWTTLDRGRMAEAVRMTADAGVWNCPTLTMWHQLCPIEELDEELRGPGGWHAARRQIEHWRGSLQRMGPAVPVLSSGNAARRELVAELHAGGARLVAGTDTGMPLVPAGRALHWELAHFVDAGLTPYEALVTATVAAAECLGQSDFGAVRPGLRADLVLLEANPLEDIENVGRVAGVMTRGVWIDGASLAQQLGELDGTTRPGWER